MSKQIRFQPFAKQPNPKILQFFNTLNFFFAIFALNIKVFEVSITTALDRSNYKTYVCDVIEKRLDSSRFYRSE
ncbi:MAG: hypothetical protein IKP03_02345 [Fibrobacter sp.]|nr:hypothetical protein [Fibrobacter sp.]